MKYEIFYVPFWHYKACMRSCICPYSLQAKTTSFILIKARLSSYSTQNFNTTKLKTDWNCSYTMHQHTVLVFMGKIKKKISFFPLDHVNSLVVWVTKRKYFSVNATGNKKYYSNLKSEITWSCYAAKYLRAGITKHNHTKPLNQVILKCEMNNFKPPTFNVWLLPAKYYKLNAKPKPKQHIY